MSKPLNPNQPVTHLSVVSEALPESTRITALADTGAKQLLQITCPATADAHQGDYFVFTLPDATKIAVWLDIDSDGTEPTSSDYTGADTQLKASIATGDTAAQVRTAVKAAITGGSLGVAMADVGSDAFTLTQALLGSCAAPVSSGGDIAGTYSYTGAPTGYTELNNAASPSNSQIHYTGGVGTWIGSAKSAESFTGDGEVTWKMSDATAFFLGGLSNTAFSGDPYYPQVDFGMFAHNGNQITIFEGGVNTANPTCAFDETSIFKVARESGVVKAYIDPDGVSGFTLVHTFGGTPSASLHAAWALDGEAPAASDYLITNITISSANMSGGSGVYDPSVVAEMLSDGAASNLQSKYFELHNGAGTAFYAWFNVNGEGADPAPGGTGLEVDLDGGETAAQVAAAAVAVLDAATGLDAARDGDAIRVWATEDADTVDADAGDSGFSLSVVGQGEADTYSPGFPVDQISDDPTIF